MSVEINQVKIAMWVRALAFVFLACGALVAFTLIKDLATGKVSFQLRGAIEFMLGGYLYALFAYVAFKGVTPPKWLFPLGNKITLSRP